MDLVQLVNSHDEPVGTLDKVEAHRGEGKLHRAASVFLFNAKNELLVQQRSAKKITSPLKWQNTCCGNSLPGESYEECAKRRLQVELGISGVRLARLGKFEYQTRIDDTYSEHEIDTIFIAHADVDPVPNPDEVAEWKWMSWERFVRAVQTDESGEYAPWVEKILTHFGALLQFPFDQHRAANSNCENLVGSIAIPVGTVGPIRVNAKELLIPLATTEGALVASCSRGAKAISESGGAHVYVEKTGMSRAPVFSCTDGAAALKFAQWLETHGSEIAAITERTSSHLKFLSLKTWVRGRLVFARFVFDPDQAMGMNMVSIALGALIKALQQQFPQVICLSLSSNVCTDKKDAGINRLMGRGFFVQAEVTLSQAVLNTVLHTTQAQVLQAFDAKYHVGTNLAESHSQNMHVANVLAALYLATGQDPAHVVDGSSATTSLEADGDGLYVAVSLPSVIVGTVGGGTWLPAQKLACELIRPNLTTHELAEAVGVACLAAEISGLSALATHTLAAAHAKLGRMKKL